MCYKLNIAWYSRKSAKRSSPWQPKREWGILVRMPMARGILTGKFQPGQAVGKENSASLLGDKVDDYVDQAAAFARVMPDDR